MRNIEWTKIKNDPMRWVVEETTGGFVARRTLATRKLLVYWSSSDAVAAQKWLREKSKNNKTQTA